MTLFDKSEVLLVLHIRSNSIIRAELPLLLWMMFCTTSANFSNTPPEQANSSVSFSLESTSIALPVDTPAMENHRDAFKMAVDFAEQISTPRNSINVTSVSEYTSHNVKLNNKINPMTYNEIDGFIIDYTKIKNESHWLALATSSFINLPTDTFQLNSKETTAKGNFIGEANNMEYGAVGSTFTSIKTPVALQELPLVSSNVRIAVSRYYALVVNPIIGIVGLVTNAISGIVIIRSGLRKPSNIFLLALAVSDWICMLRNVNIAWLLTYQRDKLPPWFIGWEMPFWSSFVCYVVDKTIVRLSNYAAGMSSAVTVLITLERLLATFVPLHFSSILTPCRSWVVVALTAACLLPPYMLKVFLSEFRYVHYTLFNASMGTFANSAFYNSSQTAINIFNSYFVIHFEFTIPLVIVIVGSVLISVKIVIFRKQRQAMIQGVSVVTRRPTRTTTTLLMVCLLFSSTRIAYLFVYLPIFDDTKNLTRNVSYIFVDVRWSLVQVNSACNIVVYVLFNPKFKRILLSLFLRKTNRYSSSMK